MTNWQLILMVAIGVMAILQTSERGLSDDWR